MNASACPAGDFLGPFIIGCMAMCLLFGIIFAPFIQEWASAEARLKREHRHAVNVRAREMVALGLSYEVASSRAEQALRDEADAVLREIQA